MDKFSYYIKENYKKIIGWGTGGYFNKYFQLCPVNIEYLIDSNKNLWGKEISEKKVNAPETLKYENPETTLIVIYSSFYDEITDTIKKYGDFYTISGDALNTLSSSFEIKKVDFYGVKELEIPTVISISRNNFALYIGGTSKFIREQMEILNRNSYINLHIFWKEYNLKNFSNIILNVVKNGEYLGMYTIHEFLCKLRNTKAIVIHNLIGMKLDTLDIIIDFLGEKVNILYYLHDFSCICRNIKLIYNGKEFCKSYEQNWIKCLSCTSNRDRLVIFEYHTKLFQRKNVKIIAPSVNTKNIIDKSFNFSKNRINVIGHQSYNLNEIKHKNTNDKIKIAYIGYKDVYKGWEFFKQIVFKFKDKYEFYCLGTCDEIIEEIKYYPVSFIEDGKEAMIKKLKELLIDVSFLWSLCAETYSYTYYESCEAGTFIITNGISGNIADKVNENENGIVFNNFVELCEFLDDENKFRSLIKNNKFQIKNLSPNEEFLKLISD